MIKLRFDFPCGAIKICDPASESIRGLCVNSSRPANVTIYNDEIKTCGTLPQLEFEKLFYTDIIPALHPNNSTINVEKSAEYLFHPTALKELRKHNGKINTKS